MPRRRYDVQLTPGAEADLVAIQDFAAGHRSLFEADALIAKLLEAIQTLETFPLRGSVPKELAKIGVEDYRQLIVQPYRVIYAIEQETVFVLIVADGRRNMQELLERRLLSS